MGREIPADKQDLTQAVVAYQAGGAVEAQRPLEPLDSMAALRAWAGFHVDTQRRLHCVGGCRLGSLVPQVAEGDPDSRIVIQAGFAAWEQPIVDGLQAMQDRGELSAEADPRRLGIAALAALQGGLILIQVQRPVGPLED